MKVKIKRFDKTLPLPTYKSSGAVAMDVYARETVKIPAHQIGYIPLNIAMELPPGTWLMVASRGSTHKMGLLMINGIAIGDEDFRGDNDEYSYPGYNFTDQEVIIEKGTRIAQIMPMNYVRVEWEEVEKLGNKDRGKYGSTGKK